MSIDPIKIQMEMKITQLTLIRDLEDYKELCNESTIYLQKKNEDAIIKIESRMLESIDLVEKFPRSDSGDLFEKVIGNTIEAIFENQKSRKNILI